MSSFTYSEYLNHTDYIYKYKKKHIYNNLKLICFNFKIFLSQLSDDIENVSALNQTEIFSSFFLFIYIQTLLFPYLKFNTKSLSFEINFKLSPKKGLINFFLKFPEFYYEINNFNLNNTLEKLNKNLFHLQYDFLHFLGHSSISNFFSYFFSSKYFKIKIYFSFKN